jgi:hypothetical protein
MAKTKLVGLVLAFGCVLTAQAAGPDWAGTWRGPLVNLPVKPGAAAIEVTVEIGKLPESAGDCATWRSTYRESGEVKGVKDYKLCRGPAPEEWYMDEGGGLKLSARWIGDVLVSPFKYGNTLLVSSVRLRGDVLEEEILTVDDQPAEKGVVSLRAKGIQRIDLRRLSATK